MLKRLLLRASSSSPHYLRRHSIRQWYSSTCQKGHVEGPDEPKEDHQKRTDTTTILSVDRSSLYNPLLPEHAHVPSSDSELVKHLKSIIKFRGGPISVAEYMEEVLTNPKAGFYMNRDVFGTEGDFITSPEVSQMFGEMVGVWVMCLWEQMGQPRKVNLVELGPGRGTLMADLLRGASKIEAFTDSLQVHMVECSPALQKIQYEKLKCVEEENSENNMEKSIISTLAKTPISWHSTLDQVSTGSPTIIIAHEFFDALPVHQFQRASRGWCEKMIDVAENTGFLFVLSPQPSAATVFLMKRYKWATEEKEDVSKLNQIEVCPKAMELTQTIAQRVGSDGGGALIIDYGINGVVSDSLQAIRKHKFVDILDNPGSADLSAYVDFASIRRSAEETSEEQEETLRSGYWRLVGEGEAPFWEGPDELAPIGMGTRYLAMAIVNKKQGVPVPFR